MDKENVTVLIVELDKLTAFQLQAQTKFTNEFIRLYAEHSNEILQSGFSTAACLQVTAEITQKLLEHQSEFAKECLQKQAVFVKAQLDPQYQARSAALYRLTTGLRNLVQALSGRCAKAMLTAARYRDPNQRSKTA